MADSRILPSVRVPVVGPGGICTAEFYRFFQRLTPANDLSALSAKVKEIEDQIGEGGAYLPSSTKILPGFGIKVSGVLSQGVVTISLADVVQEAGGTIQRFEVDSKGRVVKTGEATTDDLPEGADNQYFSREKVAAMLVAGNGIALEVDPGTGAVTISVTNFNLNNRITDDGSMRVTSNGDFRVTR